MRRSWILLAVLVEVVLVQAGCLRSNKPALARAAEYLWSQQSEDGGWHSHTYGLLRSGQSLTPFVLDALLPLEHEQAGDECDTCTDAVTQHRMRFSP